MKPRRSSSSTIIPLKAWLAAVHDSHNQIELTAAANRPSSEMPPVIHRCAGRAKASTNITTTATTQTINSGRISQRLMSGVVN